LFASAWLHAAFLLGWSLTRSDDAEGHAREPVRVELIVPRPPEEPPPVVPTPEPVAAPSPAPSNRPLAAEPHPTPRWINGSQAPPRTRAERRRADRPAPIRPLFESASDPAVASVPEQPRAATSPTLPEVAATPALAPWRDQVDRILADRWQDADLSVRQRLDGIQGAVVVVFAVDARGRVVERVASRPSGIAELDLLALNTVPPRLPPPPRGTAPVGHRMRFVYENPLIRMRP
jgi:outer membrane biosynthesis protein TonB